MRKSDESERNRNCNSRHGLDTSVPGLYTVKLDHIGIAVHNLETALKIYSDLLGFKVEEVVELVDKGMKIAILVSDNLEIELIQPLRENTPIGKFLSKRGSGIHHICFSVPHLQNSIRDLEKGGLSLTGPPQTGVKGKRVAFFHPASTMGVLIEISEQKGD